MKRGCFISLGVLMLISNSINSMQKPAPAVSGGPEAIGYLVGYWGLPIALLLFGLFSSDKKSG